MFKIMTAAMLSLTLALPGTMAQAQSQRMSDGDKVVGAILGIAAIAILADGISKSKKDKPAEVSKGPSRPGDRGHDRDWDFRRDPGRGHDRDWDRGRNRILPASCVQNARVQGRNVQVLLGTCLRGAGVNVNALPSNCRVDVRIGNAMREPFTRSCLERSGYEIRRR